MDRALVGLSLIGLAGMFIGGSYGLFALLEAVLDAIDRRRER